MLGFLIKPENDLNFCLVMAGWRVEVKQIMARLFPRFIYAAAIF